MSLKNMRFNRYLIIRYAIALLFFINLYWFLLMLQESISIVMILPLSLLLLSIPATYQQFKLYGDTSNDIGEKLKYNKYFFTMQIIVNIFLMTIAITGFLYSHIFVLMTNLSDTRTFLVGFLALGIIISLFSLKRISLIEDNKDKFYNTILEFEKAQN